MKIGYILTTFPSRTEIFAAGEIQGLSRLDLDITVLAATAQQYGCGYLTNAKIFYRPRFFSADTVLSVGYLFKKYPLALVKLIFLILRLLKSYPREAIVLIGNFHTISFFATCIDRQAISHLHAYFLSWPACIGLALAKITNRPFSIAAHARDIFVEHGAIKLKASYAKFVAVCSQQGLKHLKVKLPEKYHHRLHLNYHGIDTISKYPGLYEKNISESKHNDTIIAVGRLIDKKGFINLLKAFALVVREKPNCRLMIVGDGTLRRQLTVLIEELGLKDVVQLLGWQGHDITLRLIKQATVLVAPSVIADDGDRDGVPNVILEAFACGTVVIASSLEGIGEVVRHEQTGLLVKPGNIEELALATRKLLNDKGLRQRLSKKAYEMMIQNFDSTKNFKQLANLFRKPS